MNTNIKLIVHNSGEYRQECELRQKLLRVPHGLDLYAENLELESKCIHYGVFNGGALIACAVAVPYSDNETQIKQMAVEPEFQRQGLGTQLLNFIETDLKSRNYLQVFLHARETAVKFYQRLGYKTRGKQFIEVTIPHYKMTKILVAD